jgi:catechol 2,3-dioxygenase-like lactoylglutathione lyase family enzyme
MKAKLRIARPVTDLARTERMYAAALDLAVLARFQDHEGFSGVMLGSSGGDYHFEFTHCGAHPVAPSPTREDLLAFYLPDRQVWQSTCDRMVANGFICVKSFNPYWDDAGRTFEDPDGYRVVLQNAQWNV